MGSPIEKLLIILQVLIENTLLITFYKSAKTSLVGFKKKTTFTKNKCNLNEGKDEFRKRSEIKSFTINVRQT